MAGSYSHIVRGDGSFRGVDLIDDLGDAYEALEECYDMIQWLTKGNKRRIYEAHVLGHIARVCPSNVKECLSRVEFKNYWSSG